MSSLNRYVDIHQLLQTRSTPAAVKVYAMNGLLQNKERAKSCGNGGGDAEGEQTDGKEAPLKLPRSVVKRIVMLDEDQSRITGTDTLSCKGQIIVAQPFAETACAVCRRCPRAAQYHR